MCLGYSPFALLFLLILLIMVTGFLYYAQIVFWKRHFDSADSILVSFVALCAQIILIELFLGVVVKRLFLVENITLNIGIALVLLWISRRSKLFHVITDGWKSLKKLLSDLVTSDTYVIILLIFFALFVFISISVFILPPNSWDDYHYHLGFVGDAFQTGAIRYFPYTHLYTISFPHNIELLYLWTVEITGSDYFVEFVNIGFLLNALLVTYLLSRNFGVRKNISFVSSLLLIMCPIIFVLQNTTKVDLNSGIILVDAIYFFIRSMDTFRENKSKSRLYSFMSAVSVGIVFGSKSSAAVPLVIFVSLSLFWAIMNHRMVKKYVNQLKKYVFHFLLTLALSCILLGAFWYVRSWKVFDNPLYPLDTEIGPIHFPGPWRDLDFTKGLEQMSNLSFIGRLRYVWQEQEDWWGIFYTGDSKQSGTGPIWYILLLPSLFCCGVLAVWRMNYKLMYFLAFPLILFVVIPGSWVAVYSSFLLLFGVVSFAFVVNESQSFPLAYMCIRLIMLFLVLFSSLMITTNSIYTIGYLKEKLNEISEKNCIEHQTFLFSKFHQLINETQMRGELVVVTPNVYFPFSLTNWKLSNMTVYVDEPSETQFLKKIAEINPEYVVAIEGSKEDIFMKTNSEIFILLMSDAHGPHNLYRVIPYENK